jgi:hypothetical protein
MESGHGGKRQGIKVKNRRNNDIYILKILL